MYSILAAGKENAEEHVSSYLCYFCEKVFDNCQALRGHLRSHQGEIRARKSCKKPALFNKSITSSSTTSNANLVPSTQTLNSLGGTNNNISGVPYRASFPLGFSNQICSNGTTHLNSSKFIRDNLGHIGTQSIMSSALSSSSAKAEVCPSNRLSYIPYAPSCTGSHTTAGFPSDYFMNLGSNGVFHYNSDVLGIGISGLQSYYKRDGQNLQHYNPSTLVYPCPSSSNCNPGFSSYDITRFNECTIDSLPRNLHQQPGQDEVIKFNKNSALTSEAYKRPYFNDVPGSADVMSASKRPKISSYPPMTSETPQAKELPLIRVMEKSLPGAPSPSSAKEEDSADLDLSLHL